MESAVHRLRAMRQAIQDGRLIAGLLWKLDHKSSWEVFTDPHLTRHFSRQQQRLFRAHLPWTRLVRPTHTHDPDGKRADLVSYIRRHQTRLVLKPNTLYGGQGVVIGSRVGRAVWERTLAQALRGRPHYVVQRFAPIGTHRFPILDGQTIRVVDRHVVSGFFFNSSDIGLVGRFSVDPVVNVSRGGGILSAFVIQ